MGLFSSPKKDVEFREPAASSEARKELVARGNESVAYPTRLIADLSEMELEVERRVQELMESGPSSERDAVIQEALTTATTPADVANLPELQAIFKQISERGEIEAGRLGRGLQLRGTIGTTGGRDILGRHASETTEALMRGAAPFLAQARELKAQAGRDVGQLVGQRELETTSRLGLGAAVGELRRNIGQAKTDADYQKVLNDIAFRYQIQPGLLQSALVDPQPVITGGGPSILQKVGSAASQIAPFVEAFGKIDPSGGYGKIAEIGVNVLSSFAPDNATQPQGASQDYTALLRSLNSQINRSSVPTLNQ